MNKKLFGTLLLGSLLMGGTFVSCKDYDDDIENLQGQISGVESQITDVKALVAQLQSKLDGMTYVQSVTKSSDGKTIKFTMSNGQTVEFTDTDTVSDPGSVVTVEDGVLCIDGEPTEIKVASAINMPKVENGQIYIFDEEAGEYAATGIFVNQNTVVESATKYTITMTTSDGTTETFDVPKASGLITEIRMNPDPVNFNVAQYTVAKTMDNWPGVKPALKKGNIVFGFSTIDIRVNPVAVDLKGVEFSLVNTKNDLLPSVTLKAKPEDGSDPIEIDKIGTRANEGNGLWTLYSDKVVIEKSKDNTLDKKLDGKVAYAVTAGSARSNYGVKVIKMATAPTLKNVYFDKDEVEDTEKSPIGKETGETVLDLNKAYTIVADDAMALYDVYMSVEGIDKETFGIEIDNTARTLKYTKQPDLVTTNDVFFMVKVQTADNTGDMKESKIKVKMSSKIGSGATYDPVNYNLAQLVDDNPYNNAFVVSLAAMKTALGSEYTRWAKNVALDKIGVTYYTNEACTEGEVAANGNNAPKAKAINDKYEKATNSDVSQLLFEVNAKQNALNIGKQYYAKVTFKNGSDSELNSIVIPVKFTAPTVADQFKAKAGYVVDGVINAYFYDVDKKSVTLSRYFDAADANATLALKTDDKIYNRDNTDYNSSNLAKITTGELSLVKMPWDADLTDENATNKTETGYGKVLTVNAVNACYSSTSWVYDADADKQASFQIKIMSPIYQGTIKPADGASVKLVANSVDGSNITSEMIVATDYTGTNKIEIMPDAKGAKAGENYWKNEQITKVTVKPVDGAYVKSTTLMPVTLDKDGNITKIGYINVKANPVANDVDTQIEIKVEDAWGYKNTVKLPVTITKQ